ncbi:MAG: FlgD immunoglobulin-like domain containing protein [Thermodesulfobacteriota bacterium]|jgi:flagellar basal-body rod modification protein FlgD
MDSVSSISTAANQTTQATETQRSTTLTQADFLNLFTKQLQYQDPLSPMDNYQMATQMAQFEEVQALNDMTQLLQNLQASSSLQGVGLIGKKVEATGNTLSIDQNTVSGGSYQLAKPGKVYLQIFDANGNMVRLIDDGVKDTSKQTFTWDGKDQQGNQLPAGNYTFSVSAMDGNNQPIQVTTSRIATVTGISFENGVTYLNLGSDKITINDIIAILA